jgi:hypothetical protein
MLFKRKISTIKQVTFYNHLGKYMNKILLASLLLTVSLSTFAASNSSAEEHRQCTQTCLSQHTKERDYCQKQDSHQVQSCLNDKQKDYEQCKNQCDRKY